MISYLGIVPNRHAFNRKVENNGIFCLYDKRLQSTLPILLRLIRLPENGTTYKTNILYLNAG